MDISNYCFVCYWHFTSTVFYCSINWIEQYLPLMLWFYFQCVIVEWCQAITKYLRDQVQKIQEPHSGPGSTAGFLTVSQPDPNQALKQWHYTCKLARHMYDVSSCVNSTLLNNSYYFVNLMKIRTSIYSPVFDMSHWKPGSRWKF